LITSIANFLQDLIKSEAEILRTHRISHGPTIGDMYEGLTRDVLDRTIPASLDLRLVSGFIEGVPDDLSSQIDLMLVTGQGREIPYTSDFVWSVRDVIAVFEIKKNLYSRELRDAYSKLGRVNRLCAEYITCEANKESQGRELAVRPGYKAFSLLTGIYPKTWEAGRDLPENLAHIFHILVMEQVRPVSVIFGYEGYADDVSLRNGFVEFIEENSMKQGFGAGSFPSLIVCRNNSLVKLNGQPYVSPMTDDWWTLLASNNENPIRILIEMIWTRLSNQFRRELAIDDNLQMEVMVPFVQAKLGRQGESLGWQYSISEFSKTDIENFKPVRWNPEQVSEREWIVLTIVARDGELSIFDEELKKYASENDFDSRKVIEDLVARRILAWVDIGKKSDLFRRTCFILYFFQMVEPLLQAIVN